MKTGPRGFGRLGNDSGRADVERPDDRGMKMRPVCGARTGAGRVEAGAATGIRGIGRGVMMGAGWKPPCCCGVSGFALVNREVRTEFALAPAALWLAGDSLQNSAPSPKKVTGRSSAPAVARKFVLSAAFAVCAGAVLMVANAGASLGVRGGKPIVTCSGITRAFSCAELALLDPAAKEARLAFDEVEVRAELRERG